MKEESFAVTTAAKRPASNKDECFYCHEPIGSEHRDTCVLVKQTAVVEVTIKYVIEVPYHWNIDNVDFHRNESGWCASNLIEELNGADADGCLCGKAITRCLKVTKEPFLQEA